MEGGSHGGSRWYTACCGHRTTRFPFITQADFYGRRGLRELSESTTGATTTFAGSGRGFKDDGVGTNAQFNLPRSLAIAPSGNFVLIAVRIPGPLQPRAS